MNYDTWLYVTTGLCLLFALHAVNKYLQWKIDELDRDNALAQEKLQGEIERIQDRLFRLETIIGVLKSNDSDKGTRTEYREPLLLDDPDEGLLGLSDPQTQDDGKTTQHTDGNSGQVSETGIIRIPIERD